MSDRFTNSHIKASSPRLTTHETHTVASQKQVEGTRVTRKGDSNSQVPAPPLTMVVKRRQCSHRPTITPKKTCSANIYRRIKRRVGAHLNEYTARGSWSLPESKLHINYLELKAVFLALKEFQDLCTDKIVLVATDNTTVVSYINKEGGMRSGPLCALLWRILTRKQVTLKARHIPGRLNMVADKLSRLGQTIQTEWSLLPEVFQAICSRWHRPQIDLFAMRFNKLPLCHQYRISGPQQWMHSVYHGRVWTHMPSHQQSSWAKWWRSCRTPHARESLSVPQGTLVCVWETFRLLRLHILFSL